MYRSVMRAALVAVCAPVVAVTSLSSVCLPGTNVRYNLSIHTITSHSATPSTSCTVPADVRTTAQTFSLLLYILSFMVLEYRTVKVCMSIQVGTYSVYSLEPVCCVQTPVSTLLNVNSVFRELGSRFLFRVNVVTLTVRADTDHP